MRHPSSSRRPKTRRQIARSPSRSLYEELETRRLLASEYPILSQFSDLTLNEDINLVGRFSAQQEIFGKSAWGVALEDLNDDGWLDLIAADRDGFQVVSLLSDQYGNYLEPRYTSVQDKPNFVVTEDFNDDGNPDVAATSRDNNSVTILLGDGGGGLSASSTIPTGAGPRFAGTGDFNNDGKIDIATANTNSNDVTVLLNLGTGNFQRTDYSTGGLGSNWLTIEDFNLDGLSDIAVSNPGSNDISLLFGSGGGGFAQPQMLQTGARPVSVLASDFNSDGLQDVAVSNLDSSNISLFFGEPSGKFSTESKIPLAVAPRQLKGGDFNTDGNPDIAYLDPYGAAITLLSGDGTGKFEVMQQLSAGRNIQFYTLGDLNNDGFTDIASAGYLDPRGSISILRGNSSSRFGSSYFPLGDSSWNATGITTGDFNGDSRPDLAVASGNDLVVSLTSAEGLPQIVSRISMGNNSHAWWTLINADFNGDGHLDIAAAGQATEATILLGVGDGTFNTAQTFFVYSLNNLTAGDFNNDGIVDLAGSTGFSDANEGGDVPIFIGNGDGTFQSVGSNFTGGGNPYALAVADFNSDGNQDIVVTNQASNNVSVLFGNGNGEFSIGWILPVLYEPIGIAVADFNLDGHPDFATANRAYNDVTVYLGSTSGSFRATGNFPTGGGDSFSISAADLNQDGIQDLLLRSGPLIGLGDGTFFLSDNPPPAAILFSTAADFNLDGIADLAYSGGGNGNNLGILFGEVTSVKRFPVRFTVVSIDQSTGQTLPMRVTTSSSNPSLFSSIAVNYLTTTQENRNGSLVITPAPDQSGEATITVTVEDSGPDLDLNTPGDNRYRTRTFKVTVRPVNDAPTLDPLDNLSVNQDFGAQTVALTGLTAGGGEAQPLRVTANSDNPALVGNPLIDYVSPDNSGTLRFTPAPNLTGVANITVLVEDGGLDGDLATPDDNLTFSRTFRVTVDPSNKSPVLENVGGDVIYKEDFAPSRLFPTAVVTDVDTPVFQNGELIVRTDGFWQSGDQLLILPTAAMEVTATEIRFGGALVATWSGGTGGNPLRINLIGQATLNRVQTILRNIAFQHLTDTPSTQPRPVSLTVSDGAGGATPAFSKSIQVEPTSDPPSLQKLGGNLVYRENVLVQRLYPSAVVRDPDNTAFTGGQIRVTIESGGEMADRIWLTTSSIMGLSGNQITFVGVVVGTWSGGTNGQPLVIELNHRASLNRVQHLLRRICFAHDSDNPQAGPRVVSLLVSDGAGGQAPLFSKQVSIFPVNDAPKLGGLPASSTYALNSAPLLLAPNATVTDPDNPNFAGGVLSLSFLSPPDEANRLLIGGAFSVDTSGNLWRSGTLIGTRNSSGGLGGTPLLCSFNASATREIVQELLRSISFQTVGSSSTASRTIEFSLTDGAGGTSPKLQSRIDIS